MPAAVLMEGDARSFVERLFLEHGSALEAFLYRRTGSHADAIELAQETYVRMLQIKDVAGILDPRAYMFTVAARLASEHFARQHRARGTLDISDPVLEPELAHDPSFAEQIDQAQSAIRLDEVLAELPARWRAAFWLQHAHGMSYEEIARQLEVSKETVKKDLSKVMQHCRKRLEPP
ncbi:MAG TPA: RNA polymerase sigma factor [Burkholderiales bacterium]|nr:RNA polymerase sigma factor [Burkholderiales bacterium]